MLFCNENYCKIYLKHDKNLLIAVCSRALRERYGLVSCSVYEKKREKKSFFRIFLRKQNKKLDRNAPIRSLVLRAKIYSFVSRSLQKRRPAARSRKNPEKMAQYTIIRRLNAIFKNPVDPLSQTTGPS